MPNIARQGDSLAGHGCFPEHAIAEGWSWATIDGIPIASQGHASTSHGCPVCPPHTGSMASSRFASIEGRPITAVGDPVTCGSTVASGAFATVTP